MKKAALYIRVSTDRQSEEGYSVEFQEEKLRAYCTATDMVVGGVFIDPAYSGSNINRPALQLMISRINQFDCVLVYKLDRLSRSQKDTLYLIEDVFIKNNVDFISISESFDTSTPFGRAMVGILSVFAQLERENIKERMLSGRVQRAKDGFHNGQANVPIGYRYIDGKLVVEPYEKQQILDICELYLKGYGATRILDEMKRRGYRTSYGCWKNRSTVNSVLFNPVYRGKVTFNGIEYDGQHERLISEELYSKLLEQRELRRKGSAFKRSLMLSGLLWCEHCGGRVAGKNIRGKQYYACYSATKSSKHMIKDPNCPLPKFDAEKLDEQVISMVMDIYNHCDRYIEQHKEEYGETDTMIFDKRIELLDRQMKRLLDLYQYEEIETDEVRARIEEIQNEKSALLKRKDEIIRYDYDGFKETVEALGRDWEHLSIDEKRDYMMDVIQKIVINSCQEIKIVVNIKCGDKY